MAISLQNHETRIAALEAQGKASFEILVSDAKLTSGKSFNVSNLSKFDLIVFNLYTNETGYPRVFASSVVDYDGFKRGYWGEPTTRNDYARFVYVDDTTIRLREVTFGYGGFIYGLKL